MTDWLVCLNILSDGHKLDLSYWYETENPRSNILKEKNTFRIFSIPSIKYFSKFCGKGKVLKHFKISISFPGIHLKGFFLCTL